MKVLKIILYVVLAIVLIVTIAIFVVPTHYSVERSVTINAPKKLVMQQAAYFVNFTKWSPWAKLDTTMVTNVEGIDGQVGARYTWKGNDQVGEGSMEIVAVSDTRVDQKLKFITPFQAEALTYLTFDDAEGGVTVTWTIEGDSPRPMNLMSGMMDAALGAQFEAGLNDLKNLSERIASSDSFRGFKIEVTELSPRTYIGKMDTVKWADMQQFFATTFGDAMAALSRKKAPIAGMPSGIFFMWDEPNQQAVMAAAIPVEGEYSLAGFDAWPVSGQAYKIAYYGDNEGSAEAHYAMDEFYTARGIEYGPDDMVIEEYITDPTTEPDTSKWLTNIYYLKK